MRRLPLATVLMLGACATPAQMDAQKNIAKLESELARHRGNAYYECRSKEECDKAWALTKVFVHEESGMAVRSSDEVSISTYNSTDEKLALRAIKEPGPNGLFTIRLHAWCGYYSDSYVVEYRYRCARTMDKAYRDYLFDMKQKMSEN